MKLIRKAFSTATVRQSSLTFSASLVNGALGMVFFILVARILGPSDYGLFSVVIAVITLTADIGDLGTDTGIVRFIGKYISSDSKRAYRFMKLGLTVKCIVSVLVAFIGWIIAPFIASTVFSKPELLPGLRIGFVGVGSALLFSFSTHALQGLQYFKAWSGLFVLTNSVRLGLIVLFMYMGYVSSLGALGIYIAMPLLGFIVSLFVLPHNFYKVKNEKKEAREFFHYNKWIAAFTLLAAVSARLDTFMSARLLSNDQVGLYSAAAQLGQVFPQLVTALGTVIAPKMAGMRQDKFRGYLKKTQIMVLVIAALGLVAIPLGYVFIPLLYGNAYAAAAPIFAVLTVGMLIFLMSIPIHNAVFYYYSYPKLFFWLSLGNFAIISLLGWNLIAAYGAMGAAAAVVAGSSFNFVVPAVWVAYKLRKGE